jgi:hypothetical protein
MIVVFCSVCGGRVPCLPKRAPGGIVTHLKGVAPVRRGHDHLAPDVGRARSCASEKTPYPAGSTGVERTRSAWCIASLCTWPQTWQSPM